MMRPGRRNLLVLLVLAVAVLAAATQRRQVARILRPYLERPNVAWTSGKPASEGLDARALDALRDELMAHGTRAFLVARGGHLVHEAYGNRATVNTRLAASAASKALVATLTVLAAVEDGLLALDDSLATYVPELRGDSLRRDIHLRHIIDHTSGIDDVDFVKGEAQALDGWKQYYYDHRSERFHHSFRVAPILFPAGERMSYSGVGFYALAYAFTRKLGGTPDHDIRAYYRRRVTIPLGLPDESWSLNYGESYEIDGMTLFAFGSGAAFTGRAAARIGELVLNEGTLDGARVFRATDLADLFGYEDPSNYHGWLLNRRGDWPSLPRDAVFGVGGTFNTVLVVPSEDLVMVRLGGDLGAGEASFNETLDHRLFAPLMKAIVGPSARAHPAG